MAAKPGKTLARQPKTPASTPKQASYPNLRRGNPGNRGRAREAWVAACAKAARDAKLLEMLTSLASGDILEELGKDKKGEPIIGETPGSTRVRAAELVLAYAFGKPAQPLAGTDMEPIQASITVEYVKAK